MPLYMISFGYQPEVWAGLIKRPEDRTETVSRMLSEAGCQLHGLWYMRALVRASVARKREWASDRGPFSTFEYR